MKANSGFWSRHWRESIQSVEREKAEQGFLGWFEDSFVKYLPRKGKIIEAGCGLGYYVLALARRGYKIEGVEWSHEAVRLIKKRYPKLKVKTGDVRKLPVKDGYYLGIISLGVVEHDRKGPEKYLAEAYRVLRPGGVVFISVPHFNLLRRIKSLLGFYRGTSAGLDFYQYAFTEKEIDSLIEKAGFKVINHFRYDAYKGIKEELPFLRNLLSKAGRNKIRSLRDVSEGKSPSMAKSSRPRWLVELEKYVGHMTMAVGIK